MTKQELAKRSNVSASFLSDVTSGNGNPSLKTMESIASALNTPLPYLLTSTDLQDDSLMLLQQDKKLIKSIPEGYEWIAALLPEHQAFIVKGWAKEAKKKIDL